MAKADRVIVYGSTGSAIPPRPTGPVLLRDPTTSRRLLAMQFNFVVLAISGR